MSLKILLIYNGFISPPPFCHAVYLGEISHWPRKTAHILGLFAFSWCFLLPVIRNVEHHLQILFPKELYWSLIKLLELSVTGVLVICSAFLLLPLRIIVEDEQSQVHSR